MVVYKFHMFDVSQVLLGSDPQLLYFMMQSKYSKVEAVPPEMSVLQTCTRVCMSRVNVVNVLLQVLAAKCKIQRLLKGFYCL